MPVGSKAFAFETPHGAFGQVLVLETAASQNDPLFAYSKRDGDDRFDQGVVKLCRQISDGKTRLRVAEDSANHWSPIDND